ncbi:MAG: IS200/IS605 family transposase [Patescibacteria group bacterium]
MENLKHAKHSIGQSAYHIVWRPKYNISVFSKIEYRDVAENAIKEVAQKRKIEIKILKVMPNHVHCFVEIPTTMTLSFAIQILKGGSAKIFFEKCKSWQNYFHKGHKKAHLWSPGKFFRSVGCVTEDVVENYIKNSNDWDNF